MMFLTVPNDFSNWKKFANIELNEEFDGVRLNLARRFKLDVSDIMKGLKDEESDFDDIDNEDNYEGRTDPLLKTRNELVINSINQLWNESPMNYKDKNFITNVAKMNDNLTRLAETWSKIYVLVERIERRELALSVDHQRFSNLLESLSKVDGEVFNMEDILNTKSGGANNEIQNMSIINSIMGQISKFFVNSKKLKEEEVQIINNDVFESFKRFQDYYISLHFLIERLMNFKLETEKEIHSLLQRIIRAIEKIKQCRSRSDIKGSEFERHVDILTESMDKLNMFISKIILVKTSFANELKLFQKVKYLLSEIFQDWFEQRSKYSEIQDGYVQRLMDDLRDMPLGT